MSSLYWIPFVFVAYFAVLIGIAVVRSRQIREMSDYVLGGRRMSAFTTAMSAGSSSASAGTMLVIPAIAFTQGMISVWILASLGLCFWLTWKMLATRLRRYTVAAEESLTLPEFLEKRFNDKTGTMRTLAGGITIFFVVFYVSSGLIAGSKLLESVFGLDGTVGIVVTLLAVASYTFIGGFVAVSRTDVFQALIMLAGFVILPLTLIFATDDLFGTASGVAPTYWNPLTTTEGEPIGFLLPALRSRLGPRHLRRPAGAAALYGGGKRSEDTRQPRHWHCVGGRHARRRPVAGAIWPARSDRSRPVGGGAGGRGAALLRGHTSILPPRIHRAAPDRGHCGDHEHGRLAAAAGLRGGHRRPAVHQALRLSDAVPLCGRSLWPRMARPLPPRGRLA